MWVLAEWSAKALIAAAVVVGVVALIGGYVPLVAIAGNFAFYAVLGSVAAAAFLAWRKSRLAAMAAFGAAVLNGAVSLPTKFTGAQSIEPGAQTAKLLVFNKRWSNEKFEGILTLVSKADPDVIVFNEVYAHNRPGLRALDLIYPYRVECWRSDSCDTLILSRKTLSNVNVTAEWNGTSLGVAQATFRIGECPVTIFAAHLNRPWPYHSLKSNAAQYKQIAALAGIVRSWPGPKIVAGDMNAASWTPMIRELSEAASGRALGGWSGTWPHFLPGFLKLPIDHVIVSQPQIGATRQVLDPTGSDHSPVLAELSAANCGR